MDIISEIAEFETNNSQYYEGKNLTFLTFRDLDFSKINPISFYRSDFRGSKFVSNTFYMNNFDLADFIGNSFINTEFNNVIFGNCEFKNGFFLKCQFNNNSYGDSAIHNCDYKKCLFENETFRMTMFNCTFEDCQFINCVFDQCSTENLEFNNCTFVKVEMSTMHAENFKFSHCTLRDTYLGACFLGTYLLKDVDINILNFKYRGDIVEINSSDYFYNILNDLKEHKRFYEFLNLYLILNGPTEDYPQLLCDILVAGFAEENLKVKEYNINGIFDIIEFYFNSPRLPLLVFLGIYEKITNLYENYNIPDNCFIIFTERIHRLKALISNFKFNNDYLNNVPLNQNALLEIHCNDSSFTNAENNIAYMLNYINDEYLNSCVKPPLFQITERRSGSVIITISTCLILALLASKVIKEIYGTICEIRISHAKTTKELDFIKSSKSAAKLNEVSQVVNNQDVQNTNLMKIYNALGKDYIIGTLLKFFL